MSAGQCAHDPGPRPLAASERSDCSKSCTDRNCPAGRATLSPCSESRPKLWSSILTEVSMARMIKSLICLLILGQSVLAQAKCIKTVSELQLNNVKSRWQETAANDGKPLMISITDGRNGLVYSAKKAGELWLTGSVSVCLSGGNPELTLKNTKATKNVPLHARMALPSTQSAQIVNNQITLGGAGWGGTFVGR